MKSKFFWLPILLLAQLLSTTSFSNNSGKDKKAYALNNEYEREEFNQYLGYGYDITSGPIYDTANVLRLNNPILDLSQSGLNQKIKQFTAGKGYYKSESYSSKRELAESLGKEISGGLSIGAKISMVNVDISGSFNMNETKKWSSVQQETFSYYYIYAHNRTVSLQFDLENDFSASYLTDNFKKDAKRIVNEDGASSFISKYGTHLLTGYTLGGIFEMTNYYATNNSSYVKESTASFDAQVQLALASYANGNGEFSFTDRYGTVDNNYYSTNKYQLKTFGGDVFPGLTIDQAFTYNMFNSKKNYMYEAWTQSINEGRNLVIVNTPSSSMIPIYQVLPNTEDYQKAKNYLLDAYLKLCNEKIKEYNANNKDAMITDAEEEKIPVPSVEIKGYEKYAPIEGKGNQSVYSYNAYNKGDEISVSEGTKIAFDFAVKNCDKSSYHWEMVGIADKSKYELDPSTGLLIIKNISNVTNFSLKFIFGNSTNPETIQFTTATNFFAGGEWNHRLTLSYLKCSTN